MENAKRKTCTAKHNYKQYKDSIKIVLILKMWNNSYET